MENEARFLSVQLTKQFDTVFILRRWEPKATHLSRGLNPFQRLSKGKKKYVSTINPAVCTVSKQGIRFMSKLSSIRVRWFC